MLEIQALTKRYKSATENALDSVSFSVEGLRRYDSGDVYLCRLLRSLANLEPFDLATDRADAFPVFLC